MAGVVRVSGTVGADATCHPRNIGDRHDDDQYADEEPTRKAEYVVHVFFQLGAFARFGDTVEGVNRER